MGEHVGIERFVAAILLAVAVAGAVAFPRLLGRVETVPTPAFATHPPGVTSVEAAPFPSSRPAAEAAPPAVVSGSTRIVLPSVVAPARHHTQPAHPVTRPVRTSRPPATPAPVVTPTTPSPSPAPTPAPVTPTLPKPTVPVTILPVTLPKPVVPPTPVPVPVHVDLPGRPAAGQPVTVPADERVLVTAATPDPADGQPAVRPPAAGIPVPSPPSPQGGGSDDVTSSG
jgi:hypothetical protein